MIDLPNTPSACIRIACDDIEKVLAMPDRFRVAMSVWHSRASFAFDVPVHDADPDICCVCFAGAVMAQTLGISDDERVDVADDEKSFGIRRKASERFSEYISPDNSRKLFSLDDFRSLSIVAGIDQFYCHLPDRARTEKKDLWRDSDHAAEYAKMFADGHHTQFDECKPKKFLETMRDLAKRLEEVGL